MRKALSLLESKRIELTKASGNLFGQKVAELGSTRLAKLEVLKDTDIQDLKTVIGDLREEVRMWAAIAQAEHIDRR